MILLPVGVLISLTYSFFRTDFRQLPDLLAVNPTFLALAVVLALVPLITNTLRLGNWLNFLGRPATFTDTLRIILAGELGAAVSPTALGAAPVKVAMLNRRGISLGQSASLLGLATLEDAVFTLIAVPIGLVTSGAWRLPLWDQLHFNRLNLLGWALLGVLAILMLVIIFWLLGRSGRPGVKARVRTFVDDVRSITLLVGRRGAGVLLINTLLAITQWSARYSVITALLWGLGIQADPVQLAAIQWMCFTAMTLIPTPGAAGGAEATFLIFYAGLIVPEIMGLALFLWRFLTFYFLVGLSLLLYLILGPAPRSSG